MRATKELARIRAPKHSVEDIDLENRISNFLHQRQIPNSKRIHADACSGTVVVSGKLPSRRAKSLCMECCRHVAGVMKLIDHVVVEPEVRLKLVEPRLDPTRKSQFVTAPVFDGSRPAASTSILGPQVKRQIRRLPFVRLLSRGAA